MLGSTESALHKANKVQYRPNISRACINVHIQLVASWAEVATLDTQPAGNNLRSFLFWFIFWKSQKKVEAKKLNSMIN